MLNIFYLPQARNIQCHAERQWSISISWRGANVGFFGFAWEWQWYKWQWQIGII